MHRTCTNPQIGVYLHAFELKALDPAKRDAFQDHLIECEACFSQVKEFDEQADILTNEKDILDHVPFQASDQSSLVTKLVLYAWAEKPLLLKPAVLVAMIIFLIYPAYLGMKQEADPAIGVRSVQVIRLTPARISHATTFHLSSDQDGIISFTFPDAMEGKEYQASIVDISGHELLGDVVRFVPDNLGKAELFFPVSLMKVGMYQIVISDPASDQPAVMHKFRFQIKP